MNFDCFTIDESNQLKISHKTMRCQGFFKKNYSGDKTKLSLLNHVPCVPAWSTYPRAHVPTCQNRAHFSFLRAYKCANVPKSRQFFNLVCQPDKSRGNFSTSPANFSTIFRKNFFTFEFFNYA